MMRLVVALVAFAVLHGPARADDYPDRAITLMVPLAAGGGMDFIARTIAQKLTERLGKPVLVENRPGGGTIVATVAEAKAPPDGYTLLLVPGSTLTTNATVYKSLPYDPRKDFVPIALTSEVAFTLVVNPSLPIHSIAELVAYAKEHPGELIVGTSGIGTTTHLAGEILANKMGIKLRYAHYRGSPPAMNDVVAGNTQMMFSDPVTGGELAKAGKVRALGGDVEAPHQRVPRSADDRRGRRSRLRGDQLAHAAGAGAHPGQDRGKAFGRGARGHGAARCPCQHRQGRPAAAGKPAARRSMPAFLDGEITMWGKLIQQIGLAGTL